MSVVYEITTNTECSLNIPSSYLIQVEGIFEKRIAGYSLDETRIDHTLVGNAYELVTSRQHTSFPALLPKLFSSGGTGLFSLIPPLVSNVYLGAGNFLLCFPSHQQSDNQE